MDKYKHEYYIPKTFVIGIGKNAGFPTMKDCKGNWTNINIFENLSGFKPWEQRDKSKEISKVLNQAVDVVDNAPTSGFKIVDVCQNIYSGSTVKFDYWQCVTLRDPRGWLVSVTLQKFQELLKASNFNIIDGEIADVKLMYAWPAAKHGCEPFTLVEADENALAMQEETEKLCLKSKQIVFIKPSEFEIGKVYSSAASKAAGKKFMYMGCHDVFSRYLHEDAVRNSSYSLHEFLDMKNDCTSIDKHIFYCIDFDRSSTTACGNPLKMPGDSPYYATSSLSKLFEKVEDASSFDAKMYNSSKSVNEENVLDDMFKSPLFSLVNFSTKRLEGLDYKTFEYIYGRSLTASSMLTDEAKCLSFPFYLNARDIVLQVGQQALKSRSIAFSKFCIVDSGSSFNIESPAVYRYYTYNQTLYKKYSYTASTKFKVLESIYNDLQPKIWRYKLLNGNDLSIMHNACLNLEKQES